MIWRKIKLGEFLKVRADRFKPGDGSIKGLKRVDKIDFSGKIYLSERVSNTDMILVKTGDLLISGINVYKGAIAVYEGQEDVTATIHYSSYECDAEQIDVEFLKLYLKSPEFLNDIKEQVPGGIKTEIKPKHILPLEVLIPKLENQHHIVAVFSNYRSKQNKIALELNHQLSLVNHLRQAYIQEATQGKLATQNAHDEPAGALLEKIRSQKESLFAEKKIKRIPPLSPIQPEEIPFEIPSNWRWCRLGEICNLVTSGSRDWAKYYSKDGAIFVRMGNLSKYSFNLRMDHIQHVRPPTSSEGSRTRLEENDILISITGEVGNLGLVPKDFGEAYINQHTALVRLSKFIIPKYIAYVFLSKFLQSQFRAPQRGLKNSFRLTDVSYLKIPLPPLFEQQRIVFKLETLMKVCDEFESNVRQGIEQAAMHKLLRGKFWSRA